MFFLLLLHLCSTLIVFKDRIYRNLDIYLLLESEHAHEVDLTSMTAEDFKFVPNSFVYRALPSQWEILALNSSALPPDVHEAVLERSRADNLFLKAIVLDEAEHKSTGTRSHLKGFNFDKFPFKPIPQPFGEALSGIRKGVNLVENRDIRLNSLFTTSQYKGLGLLKEADRKMQNSLRTRAWNLLQKRYETQHLDDEQYRILLDWAHIAFVFAVYPAGNTSSHQLISWLRRVHVFHRNSKVALEDWIALLGRCREDNQKLWEGMRKFAVSRIRADPDYTAFDPYAKLKDVGKPRKVKELPMAAQKDDFEEQRNMKLEGKYWIPSLEAEMQGILELNAPRSCDLTELSNFRPPKKSVIPFMRLDPPTISKIFQQKAFILAGQPSTGSYARCHIVSQYNLLLGKVKLDLREEDVFLITEWAMITLVMHGSNMPKSHSRFIRWLISIPIDFARSRKPQSARTVSVEQSLEYMREGRDANPALWEALAKVAAGRFLADPQRDPLPLLELWCHAKGISLKEEVRPVSEILDELEKQVEITDIKSLFREMKQSLIENPKQIPHAEVMVKQLGGFI